MRILVVDDNPAMAASTCEVLRLRGWLAEWSPSAAAALVRLEVFPARVVLTDYSMPDASGIALAQTIAATAGGVRVIVTTAYDGEEFDAIARQAEEVGAVAVRKATTSGDLKELLQMLDDIAKEERKA